MHAGERKAYAYRKSIYAGGNGHNEQVLRPERIIYMLFVIAAFSSLDYHSYAYECQQAERHPMVYLFNICAYAVAEEPTYNRHKELEEAKEEIKQVVEGVNCAKAAMALANKHHVTMPIVEQINKVLFEDMPVLDAVHGLLVRDKCNEYPGLDWDE